MIQSAAPFLVVLDADSTLLHDEVIELIADHAGTTALVADITTRAMMGFTELVITGTADNDTISVSQSGNTFTVVSNGITQTVTGVFGDMVIHAGNGGSAITVASSVTGVKSFTAS